MSNKCVVTRENFFIASLARLTFCASCEHAYPLGAQLNVMRSAYVCVYFRGVSRIGHSSERDGYHLNRLFPGSVSPESSLVFVRFCKSYYNTSHSTCIVGSVHVFRPGLNRFNSSWFSIGFQHVLGQDDLT